DHAKQRLAVADESLRIASAKRSASSQEKDGLEQGRLARRIAAPDEVVPRVQVQLSPPEAANILQRDLGKTHERSGFRAASASRRSARPWLPVSGPGSCCSRP